MCRTILNVSKNASGIAACAELGRYTEKICVTLQMIKYWLHIQTGRNMILRQTFIEEMNDVCEHSFVAAIKTILRLCGKESLCMHGGTKRQIRTTEVSIGDKYEEHFWGACYQMIRVYLLSGKVGREATNREYLAPQIRSMNNWFHSEAKLPWSYDYHLANHIVTNKTSTNREMPLFSYLYPSFG